jgi:hypothetical protein
MGEKLRKTQAFRHIPKAYKEEKVTIAKSPHLGKQSAKECSNFHDELTGR